LKKISGAWLSVQGGSGGNHQYIGICDVFFPSEAKRMNGARFKEFGLGQLRNNGRLMVVYQNIENFTVSREQKKMTMFDTVVESCYDNDNRDFFSEYSFELERVQHTR
jgi:hypothetical protein